MENEVESRVNNLEKDNKVLKTAIISVAGLLAVVGIVVLVKDKKYEGLKEMGMNALRRLEKRWEDTKEIS